MSNSPFLNSIRTDMRQKGYALKTEKTYLHWIKRFILFHKKRHPQTMGSEEVRLFLSSLANSRHVAINTQKIALNALAFLYNRFLQQPLGDIDYIPASKPRRLPSVISANEVRRILQVMDTRNQVIFALLYGAGLRINECLRLRVKDFDFDNGCITVHDGKGGNYFVIFNFRISLRRYTQFPTILSAHSACRRTLKLLNFNVSRIRTCNVVIFRFFLRCQGHPRFLCRLSKLPLQWF